jgi:superfamily II DNA/RNA helicase
MQNNFENLNITSCFIKRLEERHITEPTDIQRKVIKRLFAGESIFFTSATGTGKTLAYLLPLLEQMLKSHTETKKKPELLIAAPTLELCTQIFSELEFLLKDTPIHSSLLIGSVNLERQIETLRKTKPDIIVGNPNRLLILAKKKMIKLNNLRFLVLDEADRLVSDEMLNDTKELCKLIRCNTLIACSATINKKNKEKLLQTVSGTISQTSEIAFIESEDHEILREKIEHWAIFSEKRRGDQTLRSLLASLSSGDSKKSKSQKKKKNIKALVFTSRGDDAGILLSRLQFHHIAAAGLFGKIGKKPLSSAERKTALDSFRNGSVDVLISTDLAARGLDIPGITHVIAMDVPADSEVYIHRSGRTARAGKHGIMITIGDETQMHLLAAMEKKLKIKVQPKELYYGKVCAPIL